MEKLSTTIAENMKGKTEIIACTDDYLYVEFTSGRMGYVDDVEFYAPPADGNTTIHVRSCSRLGYGDMGANRKRIEAIRKLWTDGNST